MEGARKAAHGITVPAQVWRLRSRVLKMLAEYLERALNFERMAADETNAAIKAVFEKQAAAYRKLAAERSKKLGLDDPRYLAKDE
jgi:hypothetical protein